MKALSKKQKTLFLLLLVLAQLILTLVLCGTFFREAVSPIIPLTVVIDAGHGGIDAGVTVKGVKESDLNLAFSKTLGKTFENAGFGVVQTRTGENGLYGVLGSGFKRRDMEKRRQLIQQSSAGFVISLHMNNYADVARNGPQVFFQAGDQSSQCLAESIQNVLNNFTGNTHSALSGDFFICRTSQCPSVIVECGFLSNDTDRSKLQQPTYREELCEKIYQGVMLYLYG